MIQIFNLERLYAFSDFDLRKAECQSHFSIL